MQRNHIIIDLCMTSLNIIMGINLRVLSLPDVVPDTDSPVQGQIDLYTPPVQGRQLTPFSERKIEQNMHL